jgi:hypothetical protein
MNDRFKVHYLALILTFYLEYIGGDDKNGKEGKSPEPFKKLVALLPVCIIRLGNNITMPLICCS